MVGMSRVVRAGPRGAKSFLALLILGCSVAWAGVRHELVRDDLVVVIETDTDRLEGEFGPRFDRTAQVVSVRRGGREFLAERGLPDEFALEGLGLLGAPEDAGGFVKPGVGLLVADGEDAARDYFFKRAYRVLERGRVRAEGGGAVLRVEQVMPELGGVRLRIRRSYALEPGGVLRVAHEVEQDGGERYQFNHYNHHFFRPGGVGPGTGEMVRMRGLRIGVEPGRTGGFRRARPGGWWRLAAAPRPGRAAYMAWGPEAAGKGLAGFEFVGAEGDRVEFDAGARGAAFAVWAGVEGFCPEVFVRMEVPPGGRARWEQRYRFVPSGAQ